MDVIPRLEAAAPPPDPAEEARLRRWQRVTVGSLVVGYAGYYICRSNFSVAAPLLREGFGEQGLDKEALGVIASWGVFFYAIGKILNGVLSDFVGGRRMFIFGMVGSVAATLWFGIGAGFATFIAAWCVNRLVQSMGWGALVKITSNWFSFGQYGTVMGILSLSFLFGDALARFFLGGLMTAGVGWRGIFFTAALSLSTIAVLNHLLLRASPRDVGLAPPPSNPNDLYGAGGERERPGSLTALLLPFLKSPAFWLVALLSLGLTLIREAFTFWTPTYLAETAGLAAGEAAQYSLLFSLCGGFSVLLFGWVADRVGRGARGAIIVVGLLLLVPVLVIMGFMKPSPYLAMPLLLVSLAAFLLVGPYSFLAGAISLDLGGKQGSSTAAGLVDGGRPRRQRRLLRRHPLGRRHRGARAVRRLELRFLRPRGRGRPDPPGSGGLLAAPRAATHPRAGRRLTRTARRKVPPLRRGGNRGGPRWIGEARFPFLAFTGTTDRASGRASGGRSPLEPESCEPAVCVP